MLQDRAALLRENAQQRAAIARLHDQLNRVLAELANQTATIAKLNDRIAELVAVARAQVSPHVKCEDDRTVPATRD